MVLAQIAVSIAVSGNRDTNARRQQTVRLVRGILRDYGKHYLTRIQILQPLRPRDQLALWREDGGYPNQILGCDSSIAKRQFERCQALFVFTDPLGKEN